VKVDSEAQDANSNVPAEEGWPILRITKSEKQIYERIGVVKVWQNAMETPILNQLYEEFVEEMMSTTV
jgi:hypothetical protein